MFARIKANNLFSWEDLDYEVVDGISQVTGWNYDDGTAEGSGKSSVFNTLTWVLYGKIPKDAKIDDVIRDGTKSASGSVELLSGEIIYRGRKPNELYMYLVDEKGDMYGKKQGKDAKETQILINKLIGMDFDSFCQVVYFAQDYPRRFVKTNETEKAQVLSEIQDLSIFDRARKATMDRIKVETANKTAQEKQQTALEATKAKYISNAQLLAEFVEKFESEKQTKLAKMRTELDVLAHNVETQKQYIVDETEYSAELTRLRLMQQELIRKKAECQADIKSYDQKVREKANLERQIKDADTRIRRLKADIVDGAAEACNCPTCGGVVPEDAKARVFQHLTQQKADLSKTEAQYDQAYKDLTQIDVIIPPEASKVLLTEIDQESRDLAATEKEVQNRLLASRKAIMETAILRKSINMLVDAGEELADKEPAAELEKLVALDEQIIEVDQKLDVFTKDLADKCNLLADLEILKDGYKSIKSYVFQSLLAELSRKATAYAAELFEVPIKIRFSNEGEDGEVAKISTDININGADRGIGLTSGGQSARIELAVDLALSDIVAGRSQRPIKFRIFDEPFKNMSEVSMAKAVKLFERLPGSTCIIEHNSLIKAIVGQVFEVAYKDKVSRHVH